MGPALSRRELLGGALAAAALARCSKKTPPLPPGEIVGASAARGHALRTPTRIEPTTWRSQDVVIVGGGVAGLSAGWRLQRKGFSRFEVLELEAELGGTARSGQTSVSAHPWGAHYINVPMAHNHEMIALLKEMGVVETVTAGGTPVIGEQFLCREPEERVFYKGRWYEGLYLRAGASKQDLEELERFDALMAKHTKGAFTIPTSLGTDAGKALDALSMADLVKDFRSERLRWFVDYACRDDYGAHPRDISAWAGVFYFTARKQGNESQDVITWPEGNGHLVAHLRLAIGDRARSHVLVTELRKRDDGVDVVGLSTNRNGAVEPFGIHAKHVICATPQFITARLLGDAKRAAGFTYSPWLVANLSVSERPKGRGYPLSWDNVMHDSPSLGYVVATHQRGQDRGPTVLTYYLPLCDKPPAEARQHLLDTDRDAWAELIMQDLTRAHPEIREITTRLDVMRWGHAMIRPTPGFVFSEALAKARAPQGRIHFAHSDLSGIPLFEEAFDRGLRAADAVMRVAV